MPTLSSTCDIAARKQRWKDFLKPGANPGFLFQVAYPDPEHIPLRPHLWPEMQQERVEYILRKYDYEWSRAQVLEDDYIPYLDNLTGTEIFAEAFGCEVHRPTHTSPFAKALVNEAHQADQLKIPELSTSSLAYLFDIADQVRARVPEAPLGLVDIQSPMDIAALIWEKVDLFVAMLEEPESVMELSHKASQLLASFLDEWFRRYGTEYVAHYPSYFMAGGLTLSEDEIGAVNEEMFDEFFAPSLAWLSERFGGIGIHCCADARHQWGNLSKIPGLRLLNLCNKSDYVQDAYRYFGAGIAQMHFGWQQGTNYAAWPDQYPQEARFVLKINAENQRNALDACNQLNEHPRRWRG